MNRVVLDTNIVISGLFWRGAPHLVYNAAVEKKCQALTTADLNAELLKVLTYTKFTSVLDTLNLTPNQVLENFQALTELVTPAEIPPDVVRDTKDRIVLACAVGGKADCIVSGDKDLLVLSTYENIPILKAEKFLELLSAQ